MADQNPLLMQWETKFELPPFNLIKDQNFEPAFKKAFAETRKSVSEVIGNKEQASFTNTIEALERSNSLMNKVSGVFHNIIGANSNATLEQLQTKLAPQWAQLHSEIMMNEALFDRVDYLFSNQDQFELNEEQKRVLQLYHQLFVKSGAKLKNSKKVRLSEITARLAELGTKFSQNLLADERDWKMQLSFHELKGCPPFLVSAAKSAAEERGLDNYVITLSRSLIVPFLQFSSNRALRKRAFEAWELRGANGGKTDNRSIADETLKLREERAKLLGFENYAEFKLEQEMAKNPKNVADLLNKVWEPAKIAAIRDAKLLEERLVADGESLPLEPWDWRYYAEQRKLQEFQLDEAEIKPFFQLDSMIEAAFVCAERLFGLEFQQLDVPLYHTDAKAWEVKKDGKHLAVFIGDYFARPSKRSGAWCSRFRAQSKLNQETRPIVINVCNFAKATEEDPSLLTFDDARTLFHEFGHALHSMLSNVTYEFISGTSVARDFVELPSQLFEHWLSTPEILERYAKHWKTGKSIPDRLLQQLLKADNFDQGFATVEYIASALVDLAFHSEPAPIDSMQKQAEVLDRIQMPKPIRMRHATPHFAHVFSGEGYASGYYSYMWSEVMDADAFEAFKEVGDVFNSELAQSLEKHIYSSGGSRPADELYINFRGSLPKIDALLRGRGF